MKLVDVLFMIDAAFILGAILSFFLIGSGVVRVTIFRKDGREVTPRQRAVLDVPLCAGLAGCALRGLEEPERARRRGRSVKMLR